MEQHQVKQLSDRWMEEALLEPTLVTPNRNNNWRKSDLLPSVEEIMRREFSDGSGCVYNITVSPNIQTYCLFGGYPDPNFFTVQGDANVLVVSNASPGSPYWVSGTNGGYHAYFIVQDNEIKQLPVRPPKLVNIRSIRAAATVMNNQ
eukprot:gene11740-12808_t